MNLENIMQRKRSQPQKVIYYVIPFTYNIQIGRFIETKSKLAVAKVLEGGGNEERLLNVYGVALWVDENVLDLDSNDVCPALWMYLMPLNCTL